MADHTQHIIFGILNWGLGHATRSIPVIRALQQQGFTVVLASDGAAGKLLRERFPHFPYEELPPYDIRYSKNGGALKLALQLPKILRAANKEHRQLQRLVQKYRAVGVISDNRLGFYHKKVASVYITHQLKLMLPFIRKMVSGLHHVFINRYNECWVPDVENNTGLTGEMGHSLQPKVSCRYIGWLSRFSEKLPEKIKQYRACAILSGPEPQRSLLEEKLVRQFAELEGKFLLIRGREEAPSYPVPQNLGVIPLAGDEEIKAAIASSDIVISRPGYSSVMDYAALGNNALLIPTPGQPEQEYLARYLLSCGYFYYAAQEFLNLEDDLKKAAGFKGIKNRNTEAVDWNKLFEIFQ